jgi:hypothetical protein
MATVHSTSKALSSRNSPLKSGTRPKSAKRSKATAKGRKTQPAPGAHAQGPATPCKPGSAVAERGARIQVHGRLQDMIRAEMFNLEKAEAVLRCLVLSMDTGPVDAEPPYYPDVVEVGGDLIRRSLVDLDVLYDGYIPIPLMAARKIER